MHLGYSAVERRGGLTTQLPEGQRVTNNPAEVQLPVPFQGGHIALYYSRELSNHNLNFGCDVWDDPRVRFTAGHFTPVVISLQTFIRKTLDARNCSRDGQFNLSPRKKREYAAL